MTHILFGSENFDKFVFIQNGYCFTAKLKVLTWQTVRKLDAFFCLYSYEISTVQSVKNALKHMHLIFV